MLRKRKRYLTEVYEVYPKAIFLPFLALKISPDAAPSDGNATSFYSETATGNLVPHALFVDLGTIHK